MAVDDAYTKALLHMDGADTSTTFTDESGKTWTASGNAQIDTAQKKFGTASGLFDGTGDYIDTPDHADFDVGSGDFTVDHWIRKNLNGVTQYYCGQTSSSFTYASTSIVMTIHATNKLYSYLGYSGENAVVIVSTGTITDTNWHHIALVRYGNTATQYIDGVADGTGDVTGLTLNNSANKWGIGRAGEYASNIFDGWVDEHRFSKGIARWTTNFTPPTVAYGEAADTGNFFHFF